MSEKNALAELAENLEHDNFFGCDHYKREVWVGKAQRIIAELAKEFEPIDLSLVERGADGRKHVIDFVKATDRRRCEIMIKCREIAKEGGSK